MKKLAITMITMAIAVSAVSGKGDMRRNLTYYKGYVAPQPDKGDMRRGCVSACYPGPNAPTQSPFAWLINLIFN